MSVRSARRRRPTLCVAGTLIFAVAVPVDAQLAARRVPTARPGTDSAVTTRTPAARPAPVFEMVRYREEWPDGAPGRLHLGATNATGLRMVLGGHVRARAEHTQNFLGGVSGVRNDDFGLFRVHLHADVRATAYLRVFAEGRWAEVRGRALPGGSRAIDRDAPDWLNAFAEVRNVPLGGARLTARVGRQELLLGRERIVSPLDWVNSRRTFEGAVVEARWARVAVTVFRTRPVLIASTRNDRADSATTFAGGQLSWRPRKHVTFIETYLLHREARAPAAAPREQRTTVGTRLAGPVGTTRLGWEIEAGRQLGQLGTDDIAATMFVSDLTHTWKSAWAPSVTAGLDYSSGTATVAGARIGTWNQLYPLAHAFMGFADLLGRSNVIEQRLVLQASPAAKLRLRAAVHAFQRAQITDGLSAVSGAPFRAAGTSTARDIGGEADLSGQYRITPHWRLDAGVSRFASGRFMRETGPAEPYTWGFLSFTSIF